MFRNTTPNDHERARERATCKRATFLTSEGNGALLPASTRDQTVTKGGMIMRLMSPLSARRVFQTVFFFHNGESYITNHLMTDFSGNSKLCFPRISMFPETIEILGQQNSLFSSGPVIIKRLIVPVYFHGVERPVQ